MNATPFGFHAEREIAPSFDVPAHTTGGAGSKPAWNLPLIDTAQWLGREPDPQAWIVPGWLARGTGAMFVGEDGIGKSLLAQQLVTAVAANRLFMGLNVEQVPSLYVTCEDSANVLHMRQRAINKALRLPVDCAPAMLASLAGYTDVALGSFDADGAFQVSVAFEAIERMALERQAGLIVLDNVAHLFVGNENIRQQVAGFCSAIDRLAITCNAAVVVLAHPNKAGAEYSGSTGWSAHVRQRWFMDRPEGGDRDARILRKSKANYSQSGTEIAFRWHEWAFIRDEDLPDDQRAELAAVARDTGDNAIFISCLAERTRQQLAVSEKTSSTYAPTVFAAMPESKRIGKERLEMAMNRLFRLGQIERALLPWQRDRKDVFGLRLTCANGCADAAPTRCADAPDAIAPTVLNTHSPYYVREGAPIDGGAPPLPEADRIPALEQRTRGSAETLGGQPPGLILAPGETGDEPIEGFDL